MMNKKLTPDEMIDLALAARKARKFEEAKTYFEQAAEAGHIDGMAGLGQLYQCGDGVEQSEEKALFWYKKAVDSGCEDGWWMMGITYEGTENYPKAIECYEKAIEYDSQAKGYAMEALAGLYFNGQGVQQDYVKAVELYTQAADNYSVEAMHDLGEIYRFGKGTEKNIDKAIYWHSNAAANDDVDSMLANIYFRGEGVEIDYEKAKYWSLEGAKLGNDVSMLNLADCYCEGEGGDQDYVAAMAWYKKAADIGNMSAMYRVGRMYLLGEGGEENPNLAIEWFEKALDAGYKYALISLGESYYVLEEYDKALRLFREAVLEQETQKDGEFWMGRIYLEGNGVEKDINQAMEWFSKSAEHGDTESMLNIGDLYAKGEEIEKNMAKAKGWYQKALKAGDEDAQDRLDSLIG